MALVMTEGWDSFSSAINDGWTETAGGSSSLTAGRVNGQALTRVGGGVEMSKALPSTYSTLIVGIACFFAAGSSNDCCSFRASVGGSAIAAVRWNSTSGKLELRTSNAGGGTLVATGTTVIPASTWVYVEFKIHVNGASGTGEVHLNGVTEIASTTGNFGSTNMGSITVNAASEKRDDLYIADTSGSLNNDFIGDVRIETIYPTADGANTAWTPNSGSPHFSRVNELTGTFPDGDTSYVSDSTANDRDTYAMTDLSAGVATIYGTRTKIYARKDDVAARTLARVFRQGGTNYDGTTSASITSSYAYYSQIDEVDPSTSVAWTVSGINSVEAGMKVVS